MICQDVIAAARATDRHVRDCQIRAIRGKPYLEAVNLLGWDKPPPIVIHAGIGTLVLGLDGEEFTPAPTVTGKGLSWLKSLGDRTRAAPEEIESRHAICHACPMRNPESDACTACGCGLKSKLQLKGQSCPRGKW